MSKNVQNGSSAGGLIVCGAIFLFCLGTKCDNSGTSPSRVLPAPNDGGRSSAPAPTPAPVSARARNITTLSRRSGESESTIEEQTYRAARILKREGIPCDEDDILDGMADIYPSGGKPEYAECLAFYTTTRRKGASHGKTIEFLRAFLGLNGLR